MSKRSFIRCWALLLSLGLVLFGVLRCAGWSALAECESRPLPWQDARLEALLTDRTWGSFEEGCLVTTDGDAHLVWTVDGTVAQLCMTLRSSRPVSRPELYYTTEPGQEFSLEHRLDPTWADPAAGVYIFRFACPVQVHQLRLDPTTAAGAFLELDAALQVPGTAVQWFVPSVPWVLGLAALPPLLTLAADILLSWVNALRRRNSA